MKDLIDIAGMFTDKNNPKAALDYVLLNDKHLVSTDTRRMLVIEHNKEIEGKLLIKTGKTDPLGATKMFEGYPALNETDGTQYGLSFPDYSRILSQDTEVVYTCSDIFQALSMYSFLAEDGTSYIDQISIAPKLKKLNAQITNVEILKMDGRTPINLLLTLKNEVKARLVIMPIIL